MDFFVVRANSLLHCRIRYNTFSVVLVRLAAFIGSLSAFILDQAKQGRKTAQ